MNAKPTYYSAYINTILDLQPISRELLDNVARPLRLMPTIELIKYSFVPHHQHGRRASQEYIAHFNIEILTYINN